MRLLIVPDIHENLDFLKYIFAIEDTANFDHIVLLGDYFDPHGVVNPDEGNLRQVAATISGFKEILGDKLHLLCGNHDLPYYALRPVCDDNTGRPNRMISQWLGNTTCERAEIINELWDEAFWRELKGSVLLDGWLFSHASVHRDWWPANLPDSQARADWLEQQWRDSFQRIFEEPEPPIFAAGKARGGLADKGGPIWLDFDEEFEDALEVPQIVGHTRCAKHTQKGRSYCIDLMQATYAIVADGQVELRVWPMSWLGESMQIKSE
jgi:hypothetical protein